MALTDRKEVAERPPAWKRRKEYRRAEILEAAVQALEENGADAMSMIDVGKRAGVSEATIYKYFQNRHDVVAEALNFALDPFLTALERETRKIVGCAARLQYYTAQVLHHMLAHPNIHRTSTGPMRWSSEYQNNLEPVIGRFRELLRWVLDQGVKVGELREDADLTVTSDMLIGSMAFFAWRSMAAYIDDTAAVDAVADGLVEQLLRGMLRADHPREQSLYEKLEARVQDLEQKITPREK